jgi:hypothetical protein
MNAGTTNGRFLIVVVLLAVLLMGRVPFARADHCAIGVPRWVNDRQQYETSYVYVPAAGSLQVAGIVHPVPQWAIDRQQYETSYVYMAPVESVSRLPQWAIDRQQYETNYVYAAQTQDVPLTVTSC